MSVRTDLADALTAGLHKQRYIVISEPRELDELSPSRRVVQIIRDEIAPASNASGSYDEKFILWLLSPKKQQPDAEDDLEKGLYDVIGVLDSLGWLKWEKATRALHNSGAQAYRFDLTLKTNKETP